MRKAIYNDHHIGTIALAPILLAQGLRVRRRVPNSFGRYLSIDFSDDMSLMASDGFHPGPKAYAIWGEMVARMIDNDFFRDR